MTRVAVYMGSFNPMHIGHIAVARYLVENAGFDKVYLVVSPQNPFKDADIASNDMERLEEARNAISRHGLSDKVFVDDIEFSMPRPSYSIRTLDCLKAKEPGVRFTLVIGGDNLHEIPDWKEGERILTEYGVAVYPREGYNMVHDAALLKLQHRNAEKLFASGRHIPYRIKLLKDAPLVNVSSTQIREKRKAGENVSDFLA